MSNNFTDNTCDGDDQRFVNAAEKKGLTEALLRNPDLMKSVTDEVATITGDSTPDFNALSQTPEGQAVLNRVSANLFQEAKTDIDNAGPEPDHNAASPGQKPSTGLALFVAAWGASKLKAARVAAYRHQQEELAARPISQEGDGTARLLLGFMGLEDVAKTMEPRKPEYVMQPGM